MAVVYSLLCAKEGGEGDGAGGVGLDDEDGLGQELDSKKRQSWRLNSVQSGGLKSAVKTGPHGHMNNMGIPWRPRQ